MTSSVVGRHPNGSCADRGHAVPRDALPAAAPAPVIRLTRLMVVGIDGDSTGQHRTVRLEMLPDHDKPELVQAAERGQVRADEGTPQRSSSEMGSTDCPQTRPASIDDKTSSSHTLT